MASDDLAWRVRTAHGDAWQELGRIHGPTGGRTARVSGGRLMASGVPLAQYNNVDVDDPGLLDLTAVRAWYADLDLPWGARVPAGAPWRAGQMLMRKQLMGLSAASFTAAPEVADLVVSLARPDELDEVLRIDGAAFGGEVDATRRWLGPLVTAPTVPVVLARLAGRPVGAAYTVGSDGDAGPAAYLGGVGVLPDARHRGVAGAMCTWLVDRAFSHGARLVHCHPGGPVASRVGERLGFVAAAALDVYVNLT